MNIALCYYSSTGNTELVCRYIAHNVHNARFDLMDIVKSGSVDLSPYDVAGFATSTQFMGVPYRFNNFIKQLPKQNDKPAFLFNTYGMMPGQTLRILDKLVTARGFKVFTGHSLSTPENYPPFIVKDWGNVDAPSEREMTAFKQFIARLIEQLGTLQAGQPVSRAKIKIGLFNSLLRPKSPARARREMGPLSVEETLCTGCGTCANSCPYGAIKLAAQPVFDGERCCGCWTCFNRCPQRAISTPKIKGTGHHPQPTAQLAAKLAV
jgi:ferredoxin/flavodoxin